MPVAVAVASAVEVRDDAPVPPAPRAAAAAPTPPHADPPRAAIGGAAERSSATAGGAAEALARAARLSSESTDEPITDGRSRADSGAPPRPKKPKLCAEVRGAGRRRDRSAP
jgi:hypothetical protein